MRRLRCADFGFDCDFEPDQNSSEDSILKAFAEHMEEEHGIEYSLEELRKMPAWNE